MNVFVLGKLTLEVSVDIHGNVLEVVNIQVELMGFRAGATITNTYMVFKAIGQQEVI